MIMAALLVVAKVNAHRSASIILAADLKKEQFTVTVESAVAKPGSFVVEQGTTFGEVLRKAKPKPFSNLRGIKVDEEIPADTSLVLEELKEIMISVLGAIEAPVELTLPAKSRVCDLKSKVVLTDDANRLFFKSRRMLKDGEKIEIPKKAVE